jgi:hypothetical protein
MTFQEQINALPEADRLKFFRAVMEVAEAGRKAGVPAQEWASTYAEIYNQVKENT